MSNKMASLGKACFLTKQETHNQDLVDGRACYKCSPPVELSKPQEVLAHMGAHILYDARIIVNLEPCGLCLRTGVCTFHLRKGRGADGGVQVDYKKSTCPGMVEFNYKVAAQPTKSSPCSNVPLHCPGCPSTAPAIWRYNLKEHLKNKHPHLRVNDYKDMWKLSKTELEDLKRKWVERNKVKKRRKRTQRSNLVISEAHTSVAVMQ